MELPTTPLPPRATEAPTYRDRQLHDLMKLLRATVRPHPPAKLALEKVEGRLRYILRVVEGWDRLHVERAEQLIALENIPAANSAAWMVFDADLRAALLSRCQIGGDDQAADRMAEAAELEREVLA